MGPSYSDHVFLAAQCSKLTKQQPQRICVKDKVVPNLNLKHFHAW